MSRRPLRVLLVDDDHASRHIVAEQLEGQGFLVRSEADSEAGIAALREERPDVVLLDRRLRHRGGELASTEFKKVAPRVPLVVLTGHAGLDRCSSNGKLGASAYVEKPCEPKHLADAIERAIGAQPVAMDRTLGERYPAARWLWGSVGFRPGMLALGAAVLLALAWSSPPAGLAWPANAMLGILGMAVLYWATRALPVSVTGMLVALLLYAFRIFPASGVAVAFVSDPILLLAAGSAFAAGAARSGLDRRLALSVLRLSSSPWRFAFLVLPLLALVSSFLPGWTAVAFAVPVLVEVHRELKAQRPTAPTRSLMLGCALALCFAANVGSFGTPLGSGRNLALLSMLGDVQQPVAFAAWMLRAMPVVGAAALVTSLYWLVALRKASDDWGAIGPSIVSIARARLGKWTSQQHVTLAVLGGMVALWTAQGFNESLSHWGLAGPALLGVAVLAITRVVDAQTLARVPWGTVVSFAAACAVARGLAVTGVSSWLARGFASFAPSALESGVGLSVLLLVVGVVAATTVGEVATVAVLGPVGIAAAILLGADPMHAMLATAFAASLAHAVVIATPSNAVVSALAKDTDTGEPLLRARDFLVHGSAVTALSVAAISLWVWLSPWAWTPWGGR